MKYQIYLNKDTSNFIQKASEKNNLKPATFIKRLIESVYQEAYKMSEQIKGNLENEKKERKE